MSKTTKASVPAITEAAKSASLAVLAFARLEKAAAEVHAAETERPAERSLQLVSTSGQLSALIKVGKTTVQIEGDSFAVSTSD
jgi:uncharacterized membrane protein YoaK (UPF0700 family)